MKTANEPTIANSTRPRKKHGPHFEEKMLARVMAMPAPLGRDEDKVIEARLQTEGIARRCALAMLTKPGKFTLTHAAENRAFAEDLAMIFVGLKDAAEFHANLAKTLEQAEAVLMFALAQRSDMQELLDHAKAESSPGAKAVPIGGWA